MWFFRKRKEEMQKTLSLTGQYILQDPKKLSKDITDILRERFWNDETFFQKTLADLYDPYLLRDMDKAVARIQKAKENGETLMIFGDYDVDGVTSTALLMHCLQTLKIRSSYRLPHRVEDGYGLKDKFIDEAISLWVDLLITVDCGSRDAEIVSRAKEKWLDIIITDHHHVPENMPIDAQAFINPSRPDCKYPFTWLCGAGVVLKLICALMQQYLSPDEYQKYIQNCIDIVATGTVADCMTLTDENHIIVREWLKQLKHSRSNGLYAMIEDRVGEEFDGDIFGFHIGPRLNAAGRMDTPYLAVNALLNNSSTLPSTLAKIESLNEVRKLKTKQFTDRALEAINPKDNIVFFHSKDITHGIIGIVAGRITEKYYKPSIVLIDEGEKLVASCRSPEYFSMVDILEKYKDVFISFWGHKQAAGFSILKEKFSEFQKNILAEVNAQDFSQYKKEVEVDAKIQLSEIGLKLLEKISAFKPFGMGNASPIFLIENFENQGIKFLWQGREHLRFENRYGFKIFAFGMGEWYEEIRSQEKMHIICELGEDSWQGNRGIMIRVIDIICL